MEMIRPLQKWLAGVMVLSILLSLGLVLRRVSNPLPPEFSRRTPSPASDPTVLVAEYSNTVNRLKGYDYIAIPSITDEQFRSLVESGAAGLTMDQKDQLVYSLTNLVMAHSKGDAQCLKNVMWPTPASPTGWSLYARHRLPIILTSGGLKMKQINASMETPSWEVVQRAWNIMVAEYALSNWWAAVSLENTRCWMHVAPRTALPSGNSEVYGEFAGTVLGTSLFEYPSGNPNHRNSSPVTVAAIRFTLRFATTEKPVIYVFRWEWSEPHKVWQPLDRCIGVVGMRPPDPFF